MTPPTLSQHVNNKPEAHLQCSAKPQAYNLTDGEGNPTGYIYLDTDCNLDTKKGSGKAPPDVVVAVNPAEGSDPGKYIGTPRPIAQNLAFFLGKEQAGELKLISTNPNNFSILKTTPKPIPICSDVGFFPPFDPQWPVGRQSLYFMIQNARAAQLFSNPNYNRDKGKDQMLMGSVASYLRGENIALGQYANEIGYQEPGKLPYDRHMYPKRCPYQPAATLLPGQVAPQLWVRSANGVSLLDPSKQSGQYSLLIFEDGRKRLSLKAGQRLEGKLAKANVKVSVVSTTKIDPDYNFPSAITRGQTDGKALRQKYHTDLGVVLVGPDGKVIHYEEPKNCTEGLITTLENVFSNGAPASPTLVADRLKQHDTEVAEKLATSRYELPSIYEFSRYGVLRDLPRTERVVDFEITAPDGHKMKISDFYSQKKNVLILRFSTTSEEAKKHAHDFDFLARLVRPPEDLQVILLNDDGENQPLAPNSDTIKKFCEANALKAPIYTVARKDLDAHFKGVGLPEVIVLRGEKRGKKDEAPQGSLFRRVVFNNAGESFARKIVYREQVAGSRKPYYYNLF